MINFDSKNRIFKLDTPNSSEEFAFALGQVGVTL